MMIKNKKAFYDYTILEKYEAGIVLKGNEVKSIKNSNVTIKGSFCKIIEKNNRYEIFVFNMHISEYEHQNSFYKNEPDREKKLLLHKKEIKKLFKKSNQESLTIIPLSLYEVKGIIKIEIGLAKGKKEYDKRETIKLRDLDRNF